MYGHGVDYQTGKHIISLSRALHFTMLQSDSLEDEHRPKAGAAIPYLQLSYAASSAESKVAESRGCLCLRTTKALKPISKSMVHAIKLQVRAVVVSHTHTHTNVKWFSAVPI